MESPIRSVKYIHKAIQTGTEALEADVTRLAPDDKIGAEDCARRLAFLYDAIKTHEDGEEAALFPMIDDRVYPVSAPYLLDHRTGQRDLRETMQSFERLAAAQDGGECGMLLWHLHRQAIVFNAATTLHIRKEEDILVPLIEQHFSIEEQAEMVKAAIAHFTLQQQQVVLPWILKAQTPDDQEAFLRELMAAMPPEVFRAVTRWAADAVSGPEWAEITRRIPEAA